MPHTKWVLVIKDIKISLTFNQIQNLHTEMESSGILIVYVLMISLLLIIY
jgi:hypothetical protein